MTLSATSYRQSVMFGALYMLSTPRSEDVYGVALTAYAEEQLSQWLENDALVQAINEQNIRHANLAQEDIDAKDQTWRAEAKAGGGELISSTMSTPASIMLRDQQIKTAGFVTEVFAMDNKGLNVAQSVQTSDYWQGDEAKWQRSFGADAMHVGDVEFDDSTGAYQVQVSLPVHDQDGGELIGAITFGINIQSLL